MTPRRAYILMTPHIKKCCVEYIYALPPKPLMTVAIKEHRTGPGHGQRGFLHMLIGLIADHTGHGPAEMKEILKGMFLTPVEIEIGGRTVVAPPSTEDLTTHEYQQFIHQVKAFAVRDLDIRIPERGNMR